MRKSAAFISCRPYAASRADLDADPGDFPLARNAALALAEMVAQFRSDKYTDTADAHLHRPRKK